MKFDITYKAWDKTFNETLACESLTQAVRYAITGIEGRGYTDVQFLGIGSLDELRPLHRPAFIEDPVTIRLQRSIENSDTNVYVTLTADKDDVYHFFREQDKDDAFLEDWENRFTDSDVDALDHWLITRAKRFAIGNIEYLD